MKKYYYNKNEALKQKLLCLGVNLDEEELENYVIYEGEKPFSGYPIISGETLRQATLLELISLNKLILKEGEIIKDNRIVRIPQPHYYYYWNKTNWEIDENLLKDGDYLQNGELFTNEYDEKLGYLKKTWDKVEHIWYEGATDLEKVKNQYQQYHRLNTPLDFIEMEQQGVLEDYKAFMKENKCYLESAKDKATLNEIPVASEKLQAFFNKSQITNF